MIRGLPGGHALQVDAQATQVLFNILVAVVAVAGAVTTKCRALTMMLLDVPPIPRPRSAAVIVWLAAVRKVALNVRLPLTSIVSAGKLAEPSVLVMWIVPVPEGGTLII